VVVVSSTHDLSPGQTLRVDEDSLPEGRSPVGAGRCVIGELRLCKPTRKDRLMKAEISLTDVDAVKTELLNLLPEVKSSHRVEAMARGFGWISNAALRADLARGSMSRVVDHWAFNEYLEGHGFPHTRPDAIMEAVVRVKFADQKAAIESVMRAEPRLSSLGYRYFDPTQSPQQQKAEFQKHRDGMTSAFLVDEFMRACEYLTQRPRRKSVNKSVTSYHWKHEAERLHQGRSGGTNYVANGMLIAAALHLKFPVKPIEDSPNAYIGIGSSRATTRVRNTGGFATFSGGKLRIAGWQNMMVAAVNAGLDQGVFGLEPDDNRWNGDYVIFRFDFAGIPALAYVGDAGYGELSIHVAVRPTVDAERMIVIPEAGFYAGDAFASGWFERDKGKWIQSTDKPAAAFRRELLPIIANAVVEPNGFSRSGRFMM
jgi:hypothetical protein